MSNGSSSNGEVCKNSLPSGTFLEINATKSGYDFGSRSGYVYDDAEWIIPMNPRVSSFRKWPSFSVVIFFLVQNYEKKILIAISDFHLIAL